MMFHVILSLVGIVDGLVVPYAMQGARRLPRGTALFLATTILDQSHRSSCFRADQFLPLNVVGATSLVGARCCC